MKHFHQYIINIYNLHRKKSFKYFSDYDLSSGQPKVLETLSSIHVSTQKDLAASLELEPATVTSLIRNMEKKQLINRTPENRPNGTHVMLVSLTEKGNDASKSVATVISQLEEISLEGFTSEETIQLLEYLDRIYNNLKGTN